jgi:hypothetical protein
MVTPGRTQRDVDQFTGLLGDRCSWGAIRRRIGGKINETKDSTHTWRLVPPDASVTFAVSSSSAHRSWKVVQGDASERGPYGEKKVGLRSRRFRKNARTAAAGHWSRTGVGTTRKIAEKIIYEWKKISVGREKIIIIIIIIHRCLCGSNVSVRLSYADVVMPCADSATRTSREWRGGGNFQFR